MIAALKSFPIYIFQNQVLLSLIKQKTLQLKIHYLENVMLLALYILQLNDCPCIPAWTYVS